MFIFQRYKNIGQEQLSTKFRKLHDSNIILYGQKNVGKKTLVDSQYKHALYAEVNEELSLIVEKISMSYDKESKVIVMSGIHRKNQKLVCSLIDKFISVKFVIICKRIDSIITELESRCVKFYINAPDECEKHNIIKHVCEKENFVMCEDQIRTVCDNSKTIHDLLINIELVNNCIHPSENTQWKEFSKDFCLNLCEISSTEIRARTYKLFANAVDMSEVMYYMLNVLLEQTESIKHKCNLVNESAKYQYNLTIGNKDVYHIEAFLFAAKNILMDNDVSNVFANKITIVS